MKTAWGLGKHEVVESENLFNTSFRNMIGHIWLLAQRLTNRLSTWNPTVHLWIFWHLTFDTRNAFQEQSWVEGWIEVLQALPFSFQAVFFVHSLFHRLLDFFTCHGEPGIGYSSTGQGSSYLAYDCIYWIWWRCTGTQTLLHAPLFYNFVISNLDASFRNNYTLVSR